MDRETLTMIATIVAIAGLIFLFREMSKAKADVENLKNFSAHLVQRLSAPPPPEPHQEPEPVQDTDVSEQKKEE